MPSGIHNDSDGVRRHGADAETEVPLEMVPRHLLRHSKLYTEALIHASDDKTHDSHAAQTFISKTLMQHLDEQYVKTGDVGILLTFLLGFLPTQLHDE